MLLSKGANVHAKDLNGSTPLHHAANMGNVRAIELLIASGAEVNARDNDGRPPYIGLSSTRREEQTYLCSIALALRLISITLVRRECCASGEPFWNRWHWEVLMGREESAGLNRHGVTDERAA